MSEQFKAGEIATVKNDPSFTPDHLWVYEGEDVEIIGGVGVHMTDDFKFMYGYVVLARDGCEYLCHPHELRKKRGPQQYSGELRIMELFRQSPVKQQEFA